MNALHNFLAAVLALVCPLCFGQESGKPPSRFDAALIQPAHVDTQLTSQITQQRKQLEAMLDGYLVAFDANQGAGHQARVGVPLATFANNLVQVAYGVADHGVMMQWNFSELTYRGTAWKFNAFVSQSKTAAIAVSASF